MGQTSSQLAPPTEMHGLGHVARTPTPELSEIETMDREPSTLLHDADTTTNDATRIRWRPINTRQSSIAPPTVDDAPSQSEAVEEEGPAEGEEPLRQEAPAKGTKKPARPRASRKRASDTTQRRLPSPRLARLVRSGEGSEEEQPARKKKKSLPKAARGDEEVATKQGAFSPLRIRKTRADQLSPPQVIIPLAEAESARQSQALENHVEALQERLSRAQSQLQSRAREPALLNMSDTSAEGKNPLAELRQQDSDWFSKIDEAMEEVAGLQGPAADTGVEETAAEEMHVQPEQVMEEAHGPEDVSLREETMADEYEQEMDTSDTWLARLVPEKQEKKARMAQRPFTVDDHEKEETFNPPQSAWEVHENERRVARNLLRDYIVSEELEMAVYNGQAKYIENDNGEKSVVYAEDGETFPVQDQSVEARRAANRMKRKLLKSVRKRVHESIVISELQAEMLARQPAREGHLSVEAFVAAQPDVEEPEEAPNEAPEESDFKEQVESAGVLAEGTTHLDGSDKEPDEVEEIAEEHAEGEVKGTQSVANEDQPDSVEDMITEEDGDVTESEARSEPTDAEIVAVGESAAMTDAEVDAVEEESDAAEVSDAEAQAEGTSAELQEVAEEAEEEEHPMAEQAAQVQTSGSKDPLMRRQRKVPRRPEYELSPAPALATVRIHRATPPAQGPIPTPPESQDAPLASTSHPAIVQVEDWLASQDDEPPLPPDALAADPAQPARKRKRRSSIDETKPSLSQSDPDPEEPGDSDVLASIARPKTKKARKPRHSAATAMNEHGESELPKAKKRKSDGAESAKPKRRATMSGPFTQEEKETADRIFENVLKREGLSEAELIAQIKNWKTCCDSLKSDMFDAFSDRTVDSVRKFCQRRWHDLQRGPWTEEEDDALRAAHASHPGRWTVIGDRVGRPAPACKDRWRDHLKLVEKTVGPWTILEEEQLVAAVEECIDKIKAEKSDDDPLLQDREQLEALVNWTVVAKKLPGRSEKRCREKYATLDRHDHKRSKKRKSRRSSATQEDAVDDNRNVAHAKRVVDGFEIGDYYDVFKEIHSSFDDPHQHFRDEKNVIWSIVSQKNMYSRFALYFKPSCLRRVALEHAIATWPANNPKIERRLEKVDTLPAKALVLAKWIEKTNAGRLDTMTRTYEPELIGKSKEELITIKQARKKVAQGSHKKPTSTAIVNDSESEDVEPINADTSQAQIPTAAIDEDEDATESEDADEPSETTQDVPESQFLPSQTLTQDDDVLMADVESLKGTPNISPSDFVNRLKASGSSRRKTVSYSKKDKAKAGGRRKSDR